MTKRCGAASRRHAGAVPGAMLPGAKPVRDARHLAVPSVIRADWLRLMAATVLAGGLSLSSFAVAPASACNLNIFSGPISINGVSSDCVINDGGVVTTGSTDAFTAASSNSSTWTNHGIFNGNINNSGTAALITNNNTWNGNLLSNTGGATVSNVSTWNGDASNAGTLTNSGTWTTTSAGFANSGALTTTGTLDATNGGLTNTGAVNAAGTINGAIANNGAGTFAVTGNLVGNNAFGNNGTAQLLVTGGNFTGITTLTNNSTAATGINIGAGFTLGANAATNATGAKIFDNGTFNIATTLNNGGTLTGTGIVGSTLTVSGGTFAPGSGVPGTFMTVTGDLTFHAGATYQIQVNPTASTFAFVTSTATLAGTVDAVFQPGSYTRKTYTILQSAGFGGSTFAGLSTAGMPAGLAASLSYSADDVFLNLRAVLGVGTLMNQNQQNVASALNGFFNNGGTLPPGFVKVFNLAGVNLTSALTQLDGEAATGAEKGVFEMTTQFLGLMLDPYMEGRSDMGGAIGGEMGAGMGGGAMRFGPERDASLPQDAAPAYASVLKAPPDKAPPLIAQPWTLWGAGFGGTNKTSGDPVIGSTDVTARDFGFAGGADYHVSRDTALGFALAGGGTNWGLAQGLGGGRSDAFQAGLYGKSYWGPAYVGAALSYAEHWMQTDRFAFAGDELTASFQAQSYGGRLESGYRYVVVPMLGVTPYGALQTQWFHTPSYSETDPTGGGFALTYNSMTANDTRSELGARFDAKGSMLGTMPLILRGRIAWAHDWVTNPALTALFQSLPGASFVVNGAAPPKDSTLASLGAELHVSRNWSATARFDGEFASRGQTYAGTGTLRSSW